VAFVLRPGLSRRPIADARYRDAVPAVPKANRNPTVHILRPDSTPARLRLRTLWVAVAAVALLAATSLLMARVQDQVRIIGEEAAPQAATASDLYFALSDLDAQVARLVLIDNATALAGSQIDALGTYRERSLQVDADLQRALTAATSDADRATILTLLNDLAVYRQWAWRALTVESQLPPQPPGKLPPAALGYYTQATNVLHLELLPTAKRLRDASQERLDDAYAQQRLTVALGIGLALLLGGGLVALLVAMQVWLARRFRRTLNPWPDSASVNCAKSRAGDGPALHDAAWVRRAPAREPRSGRWPPRSGGPAGRLRREWRRPARSIR
jgi:hypothetical protein